MSTPIYENFELRILGIQERTTHRYKASMISCLAGKVPADFDLPFSDDELDAFLEDPSLVNAKEFGARLYQAVFGGKSGEFLKDSLDKAKACGANLRIRLRIDERLPKLAELPWEYLYNAESRSFLAHSKETSLLRFLEGVPAAQLQPVHLPLVVLVVKSSPSDENLPMLDVDKEYNQLRDAVRGLGEDKLHIESVDHATVQKLLDRLRQEPPVHVIHFIGHGYFDKDANDGKGEGALLFEDDEGRSLLVSAERFKVLLDDQPDLRLVFLNACEGARSGRSDTFAGVAQQLVLTGVPAVVAMQFPVADDAAITFSQVFYKALVDGHPVEAAVSEARKALFGLRDSPEWGAPVLFSCSDDNRLIELPPRDGFSLSVPKPQHPPEKLCGRDTLVKVLVAELPASHQLALWGMPGVGKTSLALTLANHWEIAAAFPDGQAWIALGSSPDVPVELGRLMEQFGLPSAQHVDEDAQVEALCRGLKCRHYLLVLDDVWKPEHVKRFLDACQPPACILLTTRNAQLAAELKNTESYEVPLLDSQAAVEMLTLGGDGAKNAMETDPRAKDLLESLGGLPLALELAAQRLNLLASSGEDGPVGAATALWSEIGKRVEPSLEEILSVSINALKEKDRQAFLRLAVFGPQPLAFTAKAMAAVWKGVVENDGSELLNDLIKASLLKRVPLLARDDHTDGDSQSVDQSSANSGQPRNVYTVHSVIAALAAKLLEHDPVEFSTARLAHGKFYADVVKAANEEIRSKNITQGLASLDLHIDQVRRAVAWTQTAPLNDEKYQFLRDLVVPLRSYAVGARTLHREYGSWLDACSDAYEQLQLQDKQDLAGVRRAQGDVSAFMSRSDGTDALERYKEALEIYNEINDQLGAANVHIALGNLALRNAEPGEASEQYQKALEYCQGSGVCLEVADARSALGDVALLRYDLPEARAEARSLYQDALTEYQTIGARLGVANVRKSLGDLAWREDDPDMAREQYQAALADYDAMDVSLGAANVHLALGNLELSEYNKDMACEQYKDQASNQYQEALNGYQTIHALVGEANTRKALGDLALLQKDWDEAGQRYQAALEGYRAIDNRLGEANTLRAMGDLALQQQDWDKAEGQYQDALAVYQDMRELGRKGQANALAGLGRLALIRGDEEKANGLLQQAVDIFQEIGDSYSPAAQTGNFGAMMLDAGRREQAIPWLLKAAELFDQRGETKTAERYRQEADKAAKPPGEAFGSDFVAQAP